MVRYLLEVADTADEARELLRGLPIAMSYNLTVVDAAGAGFTAFVAPDTGPEFFAAAGRDQPPRGGPGIPGTCPLAAQRAAAGPADRTARQPGHAGGAGGGFQTEPLYNAEYSRAFGTLYTALYLPAEEVVEYRWPDVTWRRGFDDTDDTLDVVLTGS